MWPTISECSPLAPPHGGFHRPSRVCPLFSFPSSHLCSGSRDHHSCYPLVLPLFFLHGEHCVMNTIMPVLSSLHWLSVALQLCPDSLVCPAGPSGNGLVWLSAMLAVVLPCLVLTIPATPSHLLFAVGSSFSLFSLCKECSWA